jgi:hypothetical protein
MSYFTSFTVPNYLADLYSLDRFGADGRRKNVQALTGCHLMSCEPRRALLHTPLLLFLESDRGSTEFTPILEPVSSTVSNSPCEEFSN